MEYGYCEDIWIDRWIDFSMRSSWGRNGDQEVPYLEKWKFFLKMSKIFRRGAAWGRNGRRRYPTSKNEKKI